MTKAYLDAGIAVKYISPVNEPQSQWDAGWQEGCYFGPEPIFRLTRLLIRELSKRDLPVKVSINESAEMKNREYVYDFYRDLMADDTIYPHIDHFAAHGYHTDFAMKQELHRFALETAASLGREPPPSTDRRAAWHQTKRSRREKRLT